MHRFRRVDACTRYAWNISTRRGMNTIEKSGGSRVKCASTNVWMDVLVEWMKRQPEWAWGERPLKRMTETRDTRCAAQSPIWQFKLLSRISLLSRLTNQNDHWIRRDRASYARDFIIINHCKRQRALQMSTKWEGVVYTRVLYFYLNIMLNARVFLSQP